MRAIDDPQFCKATVDDFKASIASNHGIASSVHAVGERIALLNDVLFSFATTEMLNFLFSNHRQNQSSLNNSCHPGEFSEILIPFIDTLNTHTVNSDQRSRLIIICSGYYNLAYSRTIQSQIAEGRECMSRTSRMKLK